MRLRSVKLPGWRLDAMTKAERAAFNDWLRQAFPTGYILARFRYDKFPENDKIHIGRNEFGRRE